MTGKSLPYGILDGKPLPMADASERLSTRLFMYGEGCFDTLRSCAGGFLHPDRHLQRLHKGMEYLGWNPPDLLHDELGFLQTLWQFLNYNNATERQVRIRIQVWADDHTTGYRTAHDRAPSTRFLITGSLLPEPDRIGQSSQSGHSTRFERFNPLGGHLPGMDRQQLTLATSRYRRIASDALPPTVKWTNGINYILAAREAAAHGSDDALMLSSDGFVSETTIANIFWKHHGEVFTPSDDCDLLPGVTRALLMQILGDAGYPVKCGRYTPDHLEQADTVWVCNSVREIAPVMRLDAHSFEPDRAFLTDLYEHYQQYKKGNIVYAPTV